MNCIVLAACKAEYISNNVLGLNRIATKCSLLRDYITIGEFVVAKDGSRTGMLKTDKICVLNFKTFMDTTRYG